MSINKKILLLIQARYNSSRFPGKVIRKIGNKTILEIVVSRLKKSKKINKIVVVCSNSTNDEKIVEICKRKKISFFQGDEKNVLKRYYFAAKKYKYKNIVRITADCPLIDYKILDNLIALYLEKKVDYASNTDPPTFPDGLDVEIFSFKVLKEAYQNAYLDRDKEHVTTYIKNSNIIKKYNLVYKKGNFSNIGLTVDTLNDLKKIEEIYLLNKKKLPNTLEEILKIFKIHRKKFVKLKNHKRNKGYDMIEGQKLWTRAKSIIAGGNSLFSKNPNLFLPGKWPVYFNKTKGINIWDLENIKYFDFSFMGVGTNILGYSRKEVDQAVTKIIKLGNISTFNSKEEVDLAEKLLSLNNWADKVRYCRSGGEASAVAVRLARAATGKDKILFCGYHGWHDWYLSSNISNPSNLDQHLMQNIKTNGIPKVLKNSSIPFEYNNIKQLKKLISNNEDISAVIMEVQRDKKPNLNFLKEVRSLTKEKNIILIFDECTSGFRETFGGIHKKYNINPDVVIYGKALGNGYAINAIIGIEEVMSSIKNTFVSSTFWSERIGFAAGLATLNVMEKLESWKIISQTGKIVKQKWENLSLRNKVKIKISGLDAIPRFDFEDKKNYLIYKTFLTQEFLKKKYLASNVIYLSVLHDSKILNNYFDILDEVFYKIGKSRDEIKKMLDSEVCIGGIRSAFNEKKFNQKKL
jgi:glutamate-1-semialdehyde aminotransferase/spore coat polysaccharide biosynthesis protein SpsF (cytidylyltransferase family)